MTLAVDLHTIDEDERIAMIAASAERTVVGVVLEKDELGKVERYIKKLTTKYQVRHIATIEGPIASAVIVQFGPKVVS